MSNFGYDIQKVVERKPDGKLEEQGYALFKKEVHTMNSPPMFMKISSPEKDGLFFDYHVIGLYIKEYEKGQHTENAVGTLSSSPLQQSIPIIPSGQGLMNLELHELETASKQIFKALQGL